MPINPPTDAEIAGLVAFSHRWLVQGHIDAGRTLEAVLAMHYDPAVFAEWDRRIEVAFWLGWMMKVSE